MNILYVIYTLVIKIIFKKGILLRLFCLLNQFLNYYLSLKHYFVILKGNFIKSKLNFRILAFKCHILQEIPKLNTYFQTSI